MAVGETLAERATVALKGRVADPRDEKVKLQVELRRLDEYGGSFTGSPTRESDWVSSGSEVKVWVFDLVFGDYHWQARTMNSSGKPSDWVPFGDNPNSEADFRVRPAPNPPSWDLGFRPNPDGFSFANFKLKGTWKMFEKFFGPEETTHANGQAKIWAERFFKERYSVSMASCFGFSAATLVNFFRLAEDRASPDFDMPDHYGSLWMAGRLSDIDEALAYYQRTQFSREYIEALWAEQGETGNSPRQAYEILKRYLLRNEPAVLVLREEREGLGPLEWQEAGVHAVVPYRYYEENHTAYVDVYDPNAPGSEDKKIILDLENDQWSYVFIDLPGPFDVVWEGDASSDSIDVVPLTLTLIDATLPPSSWFMSSAEGPVTSLFTDPYGRRLGWVDGSHVNEIPDALDFRPAEQDSDQVSPLYLLPRGVQYTVTLHGTSDGTASVSLWKEHSLLALDNVRVGPSTEDSITVGANGGYLTYTTNDDYKEYSATIDEELPDASRAATVNTTISRGDVVALGLEDQETFRYVNTGGPKSYDLTLEQRGSGGGKIRFSGLAIGEDETQIVRVADWNSLGITEVILEIDENSDGTIDGTQTLEKRTVMFKLNNGWNHTCYTGQAQTLEDALSGTLGNVLAVYRLGPDQQFDRWFPGRADISTMADVSLYDSLFVLVDSDVDWSQEPAASGPRSVELAEGWNSVCYSAQTKPAEDATSGVSGGLSILYMLGADQTWARFVPNRPDVSNVAELGTYASVLVLVTQAGGAQWVFDP